MTRRYELKKRAEHREATRQRIVEAAIHLHGTVGPAATQVTDIADRAGVERATVYRHFPDLASLFEACTGHFLHMHPGPDISAWSRIDDPEDRLRSALTATYAYFEEHPQMFANILRDAEWLESLGSPPAFVEMETAMVQVLARGWRSRGKARTRVLAALGLAMGFHTWRSLVHSGLDSEGAVELMVGVVAGVAGRN